MSFVEGIIMKGNNMKNFNLKSLLIALVATFAIIATVFCSNDACASYGSPYSHRHYSVSRSVGYHGHSYRRHSYRHHYGRRFAHRGGYRHHGRHFSRRGGYSCHGCHR